MARKKRDQAETSPLFPAGPRVINDPELCARMAVPHATVAAAAAAWDGFYADVRAAREKHRIAEVVVIGELHWLDEPGPPAGSYSLGNMGHLASMLFLTAFAYGQLKREQVEQLARLENPPGRRPGEE